MMKSLAVRETDVAELYPLRQTETEKSPAANPVNGQQLTVDKEAPSPVPTAVPANADSPGVSVAMNRCSKMIWYAACEKKT